MEEREEAVPGGPSWRVYAHKSAELRTAHPRPDVVYTVHRGHFGRPFVAPVVAAIEAALAERRPVWIFHDWAALRDYDPHARARLTSWVFGRLRDVASLEVLLTVDSRLLSMGIAASNLLLGGRMTVHEARATFDARIAAILGPLAPSLTGPPV